MVVAVDDDGPVVSGGRLNVALDWISSFSFCRAMLTLAPRTFPSGVSTQAYRLLSPTQYATSVERSRIAIDVSASSVGGGAEASLLSAAVVGGGPGARFAGVPRNVSAVGATGCGAAAADVTGGDTASPGAGAGRWRSRDASRSRHARERASSAASSASRYSPRLKCRSIVSEYTCSQRRWKSCLRRSERANVTCIFSIEARISF